MKYIKKFENNKDIDFDDWVKVKKTGEIGFIISRPISSKNIKYHGKKYYGVVINNKVIEFTYNEIKKLTPEEVKLYIDANKYNL